MTQKELLYVEDAIGHEKNIISIFENLIDSIEDDSLINFLDKELKKHEQLQEKLCNHLKEKANER